MEKNLDGAYRDLEIMPFDKQGKHATGQQKCMDGEWWDVYLDHNGEEVFLR